ncbi:hypothetical protein TIFTF001_041783 [Ficus carica]|uniref:Uncharacterized protein n=1 Tax=Ficus carica TaxID=3494 RepID=A0AA88CW54_FICCA|nr:hypothetical protein TIFTF001_041783 [Ficus carica]
MDEQDNQDFQDIDNPAPTGSQGTQRPQRGRRARAQRKPTQTEILTENARSLTEMVRALVREPRCNPSPTGDRRSDRPHRESLGLQQQERAEPSKLRSRSRHSQATRSGAAKPPMMTEGYPDVRRRDTMNIRGSTTSMFDRLGRPGVHQRIVRERSVDKPAKEEDNNQNRLDQLQRQLDQLQRQLDQLVGQQFWMEQFGAMDPPFTPDIMASPYPARFKMPSVAS